MSVLYQIEDGILRFQFMGGSSSKEVYTAVHRAYEDPNCPKDVVILTDLRGSTSLGTRSMESVQTLSKFILEHPSRPGRKVAILVAYEEMERFVPMAATFSESTDLDIEVFDEEEAARQWLIEGSIQAGEG